MTTHKNHVWKLETTTTTLTRRSSKTETHFFFDFLNARAGADELVSKFEIIAEGEWIEEGIVLGDFRSIKAKPLSFSSEPMSIHQHITFHLIEDA